MASGPSVTWRERAEMVSEATAGTWRLLGEDERGDLFVSRDIGGYPIWDRRFDGRKPWHWPFWVRSRWLGQIAFLTDVEMPRG